MGSDKEIEPAKVTGSIRKEVDFMKKGSDMAEEAIEAIEKKGYTKENLVKMTAALCLMSCLSTLVSDETALLVSTLIPDSEKPKMEQEAEKMVSSVLGEDIGGGGKEGFKA